jgi:hypothetical protein
MPDAHPPSRLFQFADAPEEEPARKRGCAPAAQPRGTARDRIQSLLPHAGGRGAVFIEARIAAASAPGALFAALDALAVRGVDLDERLLAAGRALFAADAATVAAFLGAIPGMKAALGDDSKRKKLAGDLLVAMAVQAGRGAGVAEELVAEWRAVAARTSWTVRKSTTCPHLYASLRDASSRLLTRICLALPSRPTSRPARSRPKPPGRRRPAAARAPRPASASTRLARRRLSAARSVTRTPRSSARCARSSRGRCWRG